MGLNLFEGSGSDDDDNESKIEINEEFARRFDHNKKREDLQRLEELKKKGLAGAEDGSSESSDDEEEDDLIVSGKKDLEFLNALIKVKNRDPILKQKDAKLFEYDDDDDDDEEEEEEEEEEEKPKMTKNKPVYLKDVVAKQLIEEGPEFEESTKQSLVKSYSESQEELRQALLNAAEESDGDEGDLFSERKGNQGGDREDAEDGDDDEIQKRLDEYFGKDENLDEKQVFLKSFFLNKMWVDKDEKSFRPSDPDVYGVSEDEEEIEKQEKYEAEYNFRYEEGAGDRVLGHARFTEGSVRKKENARKLQRKSKKERMAQAELERKEELKHLKNLKKKEIMEKLEKIKAIAGIADNGACALDEDDLEEDFDSEEFDRKMKQIFDEDYYEAVDADPDFCSDKDEDDEELTKPNFEKEDELLGLPKGWDSGSAEGFLAARERALRCKPDTMDVESSDDQGQKEEEPQAGSKRKRKHKMSLQEKAFQDKAWDEYYNLDYEDTIGDIKTRFKYTTVPSKRYGLSAGEILMMDDKELNQYVSLKKLAPYHEKEWKIHRIKRYEQKMKNKLLLQGENFNAQKAGKKHRSKVVDLRAASTTGSLEQEEVGQLNGEVGTSKGIRRRRRHAELKLSRSRLMAYGKIPSKSKNKIKH